MSVSLIFTISLVSPNMSCVVKLFKISFASEPFFLKTFYLSRLLFSSKSSNNPTKMAANQSSFGARGSSKWDFSVPKFFFPEGELFASLLISGLFMPFFCFYLLLEIRCCNLLLSC